MFDYELLGFHRPIIIITIPNETEQYFEAIPWIIFGLRTGIRQRKCT
jgi:hypothetical protein